MCTAETETSKNVYSWSKRAEPNLPQPLTCSGFLGLCSCACQMLPENCGRAFQCGLWKSFPLLLSRFRIPICTGEMGRRSLEYILRTQSNLRVFLRLYPLDKSVTGFRFGSDIGFDNPPARQNFLDGMRSMAIQSLDFLIRVDALIIFVVQSFVLISVPVWPRMQPHRT